MDAFDTRKSYGARDVPAARDAKGLHHNLCFRAIGFGDLKFRFLALDRLKSGFDVPSDADTGMCMCIYNILLSVCIAWYNIFLKIHNHRCDVFACVYIYIIYTHIVLCK